MPDSSSPTTDIDFSISGMSCASCVRRVEKAIKRVAEVDDASVNLTMEQARVKIKEGQDLNKVTKEIELVVHKAGYTAKLIQSNQGSAVANLENKEQFHLIMAAILSLPLFLSMIIGNVYSHWMLPGWIQFLLATPVQFWLGGRFYSSGYRAVKAGTGNMDLLVALGSTAAWGLSTFLLVANFMGKYTGTLHLYYESSALIITFILLGHWLEKQARHKAATSIHALHKLQPESVHKWLEGKEEIIPLERLQIADEVVVRPGERIPCDGIILEGESAIDESMLTGEVALIDKNKDDQVVGGSLNVNGRLIIKAIKVGRETRLAAIVRLVEGAQASKAPIQKRVDRISAVFVPIVIGLAGITFIGWWISQGEVTTALINAASVLVIACPCALGLATPTALATGCGAAARAGILIRDAEALEKAVHVQRVAFDKTGTLTEGRLSVASINPVGGVDKKTLLYFAASLSTGSEHPLAKALVNYARQEGLTLSTIEDFRVVERQGRGVKGTLNGQQFLFGNRVLMEYVGIDSQLLQYDTAGKTISWLAQRKETGTQLLGAITFQDHIRVGAVEAVRRLQQQGMHVLILTGDHKQAAEKIAKEVGIVDVRSELSPEEKQKVIAELGSQGEDRKAIAMVGDGINDAPALAFADLAIAVGEGTDAAAEVAGVVLMRTHPGLVADTLDIARQTTKRIKEGLFWAFVYNVVGIPLAALGFLSPAMAGGAMALSSVCVVSNALRLLKWRPQTEF